MFVEVNMYQTIVICIIRNRRSGLYFDRTAITIIWRSARADVHHAAHLASHSIHIYERTKEIAVDPK